jgi:hypothetical protein
MRRPRSTERRREHGGLSDRYVIHRTESYSPNHREVQSKQIGPTIRGRRFPFPPPVGKVREPMVGLGSSSPIRHVVSHRLQSADSRPSRACSGTGRFVKGFRTPAICRREGMHGGRRPKSLEGGNRGGVCAGGGVSLWGFYANFRPDFSVPDRDDG